MGDEAAGGKLEKLYEQLCRALEAYQPSYDAERLKAAYDFTLLAHAPQKRKSGEPYAVHPLEVAIIVAEMSLDLDAVIAALLHDTIEDTGYDYADIKSRFGAQVADMVDGVTKLTRVPYTSKEEQQMENLRKMFLAMARDIRVILIKISDRLHNMRTLEYHTEAKRREKSLETMEIYAPLAHRLGMQRVKWELEDLALKNLDPVGYNEITKELENRRQDHEGLLSHVKNAIAGRLKEAEIKAHIEGRVKHVYSIYRKMYGQHRALFEIYDLYAVRVIVSGLADCYNVLGFIHDLYKPIPGRFKDYISTPKPNMYQSLHTTVIGREGVPFEVQIRTWEMHKTAEYGIAAHWKYKQGVDGESALDQRLEWVRRLLESQQDTDAEDFIRTLKVDMFADEVFVFTPRGDVINLPNGANPIDFAYAIHSAVGNRMTGAKINNRMVSLDYQLQNGDIVEILTGPSHGPSRDWLKMVKTSEARNKIKQWFKKEKREENIVQGRADLEREIRRAGLSMNLVMNEDIIAAALKRMSFPTLDDLHAAIGFGGITTNRVINRLRDELVRANRVQTAKVADKMVQTAKKARHSASGVIVDGLENCLVKFSRCCSPLPGDEIVGFITRGYGVSIHRSDCQNVVPGKLTGDAGRWVEVEWADDITDPYSAFLQVMANNRDGLVMDLLAILAAAKVPVLSLNAKAPPAALASVSMLLEVKDRAQLEAMVSRLSKVQGVLEIGRRESTA